MNYDLPAAAARVRRALPCLEDVSDLLALGERRAFETLASRVCSLYDGGVGGVSTPSSVPAASVARPDGETAVFFQNCFGAATNLVPLQTLLASGAFEVLGFAESWLLDMPADLAAVAR